MDLSYSEQYEAYRAEVASFLAANWPPQGAEQEVSQVEQASRFRAKAIEAGYLARAIPKRYGGSEQDADVLKAQIIREEFARAHAPGEVAGIGPGMLVPTLLERGEEWQKEKFVGPTIRGEIVWCQGYSEPGSGSDLASLQTKAELVGDEWVINGQKIWTSGAHRADYMFILCRTEPDQPKHAGISYLLLDMKRPGIEVRPLKQMNGAADFNEVFFDDVRTPADWIVGRRGEGWLVSRTTLKHERNMIGNASRTGMLLGGLVNLARRTTRNGKRGIEDADVRQRLVELEGYIRAHEYSSYRLLTKAAKQQDAGLIQMMNKLNGTNIGHRAAQIGIDLLGDQSLVAPNPQRTVGPIEGTAWVNQFMWSLGTSLAGGTSNIQRNVIGERGLGLPRDEAAQRSK